MILHQLVTGRLPVDEPQQTPFDLARRITRESVLGGASASDSRIDWLDSICYHCLRKAPEKRCQTTALLADYLEAFRKNLSTPQPPPRSRQAEDEDKEEFNETVRESNQGLREERKRRRRTRRRASIVIGVISIAVLVLGIASWLTYNSYI